MQQRRRFGAAVLTGTVLVLASLLTQPSFAQTTEAKAAANRPIPRLPDGHLSFGPPPGEKGVWNRGDYRPFVPTNLTDRPARPWRQRPRRPDGS